MSHLQPSDLFSLADKKTDVAATVLRMLYIQDLRGLQTIVDETLVNVQVRGRCIQMCHAVCGLPALLCFTLARFGPHLR